MTQQPVQIQYRFDYSAEKDVIQFSIKLGGAPTVSIGLDADSFFKLCDGIIEVGKPFLDSIKKKRAKGIREDATAELTSEELDKLMNLKKKLEGKDADD